MSSRLPVRLDETVLGILRLKDKASGSKSGLFYTRSQHQGLRQTCEWFARNLPLSITSR